MKINRMPMTLIPVTFTTATWLLAIIPFSVLMIFSFVNYIISRQHKK